MDKVETNFVKMKKVVDGRFIDAIDMPSQYIQLSFSSSKFNDDIAEYMAEKFLEYRSIIKAVSMPEQFSPSKMSYLLDRLADSNTIIENIYFYRESFDDTCAQSLANFISKSKTLKRLTLGSKNVTDETIVAISPAIMKSSSLEEINMFRLPNIDNKSFEVLVEIVKKKKLKVDVRETKISNGNGKYLDALNDFHDIESGNSSHFELDLANRKLSDEGMKDILTLLTKHDEKFNSIKVLLSKKDSTNLQLAANYLEKKSNLEIFSFVNEMSDEDAKLFVSTTTKLKNIKKISTKGFSTFKISPLTYDLLFSSQLSCKELEEITFENGKLLREDTSKHLLNFIDQFPKLRVVEINNFNLESAIINSVLDCLSGKPNIESIDLSKNFADVESLKKIEKMFKSMKSLKYVKLDQNNKSTDDMIPIFRGLLNQGYDLRYSLSYSDAEKMPLLDVITQALQVKCMASDKLQIEASEITDELLEEIISCLDYCKSNLYCFAYDNNSVNTQEKSIAQLSKILNELSSAEHLLLLHLDGAALCDESLASIADFLLKSKRPKVISFPNGEYLTESSLELLKEIANKAKITIREEGSFLSRTSISQNDVDDIIHTITNGITGITFSAVAGKSSQIRLFDMQLDDEKLTYAHDLIKGKSIEDLKQLDLSRNNITSVGAEAILNTLSSDHFKNIQVIDLSGNQIDDSIITSGAVVNVLIKCEKLKEFTFGLNSGLSYGNKISDQGIFELGKQIAAAKSTLNKLTKLRFGGNKGITNSSLSSLKDIVNAICVSPNDVEKDEHFIGGTSIIATAVNPSASTSYASPKPSLIKRLSGTMSSPMSSKKSSTIATPATSSVPTSVIDESKIPLHGISIRWFIDFVNSDPYVTKKMQTHRDYYKTSHFVNRVKELTKEHDESLCERLVRLHGSKYVKPKADVFISHAWNYLVDDICTSVGTLIEDLPPEDDLFMWFDTVIVNQHKAERQEYSDDFWSITFHKAINDIGRVAVVMTPWHSPYNLTRSWCLWELYGATLQESTKVDVIIVPKQRETFIDALVRNPIELMKRIEKIDVTKATAWKKSDQERILDAAKKAKGGIQAVQESVVEPLRKWMMNEAFEYMKSMEELLQEDGKNVTYETGYRYAETLGTYYQACRSISKYLRSIGDTKREVEYREKPVEYKKQRYGEDSHELFWEYVELGAWLHFEGKSEDANQSYDKAYSLIRKKESETEALASLGGAMVGNKVFAEAKKYLVKALELLQAEKEPNTKSINYVRENLMKIEADELVRCGKDEEAIKLLEKAKETFYPPNPKVYSSADQDLKDMIYSIKKKTYLQKVT